MEGNSIWTSHPFCPDTEMGRGRGGQQGKSHVRRGVDPSPRRYCCISHLYSCVKSMKSIAGGHTRMAQTHARRKRIHETASTQHLSGRVAKTSTSRVLFLDYIISVTTQHRGIDYGNLFQCLSVHHVLPRCLPEASTRHPYHVRAVCVIGVDLGSQ